MFGCTLVIGLLCCAGWIRDGGGAWCYVRQSATGWVPIFGRAGFRRAAFGLGMAAIVFSFSGSLFVFREAT